MPFAFAPATKPLVSVIVLAWKLTDELYDCLLSIQRSLQAPSFEVIVVNNGAESSVREMVKNQIRGARIIDLSHNIGFGQACNYAALAAKGEYLLFINDDAVVAPTFISNIVETAQTDPKIAAVAGLILNQDGSVQEAGSKILSSAGTVQLGKSYTLSSPEATKYLHPREIDYGSGAALLVKKSAFELVGGFDPRYEPAYYEDVDLCLSLKSAGFTVVLAPEAKVTHISGASTGTMRRFREFAASCAGDEFRKKWEEIIINADGDELELLSVPLGCVELPGEIFQTNQSPEEMSGKVKERYIAWLESEIARFNPFDYEVTDELTSTRNQLAEARDERDSHGAMAHALFTRLNDLENRNIFGILKWQVGKRMARKKR